MEKGEPRAVVAMGLPLWKGASRAIVATGLPLWKRGNKGDLGLTLVWRKANPPSPPFFKGGYAKNAARWQCLKQCHERGWRSNALPQSPFLASIAALTIS